MALLFTFSQSTQGRLDSAQVTLFINGVRAVVGNPISTGDIITIKTIPGRRLSVVANTFTFASSGVKYFTYNDDKSVGTLDLTGELNTVTANAFGSEVDPTVLFMISQLYLTRLANANLNMTKSGVPVAIGTVFRAGEEIKIEVNSPSLMITSAATYLTIKNSTFTYFALSNEGKIGIVSLDGTGVVTNFVCATEASGPVVTPVWKLTNADITRLNDNYAYLYKNDVRAVSGTEFFLGDVVKVKPSNALSQLQNAWLNSTDSTGAYQRLILVQNADKSEGVYTIDSERPITSFIVTTKARPTKYIFKQSDVDAFNNAQATLRVNGVLAVLGTNIGVGDVLLAIANSGRVFTASTPSYETSSGGRVSFIHNEDDKQASVTVVEEMSNAGNFSNFDVSTVLAPSPDVRGLNNVYKVTQNQLKSITQKRFEVNQQGQIVDYGNYIVGLIELPFKTDLAYDVGSQDVQLGPKKTDIDAILLDRDNIRLNLGVIRVSSVKNNFLDYKNATALIHLPYSEPINIDMEYVIDQDVTIDYIINLYDGTATINIASSKTGEIVITQNIDMGIVVPFANVDSFPTKNDPRSIKLGSDNGIKTAFIEILRNESILENGFFTIPVVDEKPLSTYTGFAQVEQINLKSKATSFEKDLIISQLRDGVIIK